MEKIDWSEAPIGATHFLRGTDKTPWAMRHGQAWYYWSRNNWCPMDEQHAHGLDDPMRAVPRPLERMQWPTDEERIDMIGHNGPSGEHYEAVPA